MKVLHIGTNYGGHVFYSPSGPARFAQLSKHFGLMPSCYILENDHHIDRPFKVIKFSCRANNLEPLLTIKSAVLFNNAIFLETILISVKRMSSN